jgi:hypothetical protein
MVLLIAELTSSPSAARLKTGLELLHCLLPSASPGFVAQLAPNLSHWASAALCSGDAPLALCGFRIFACMVRQLGGPFPPVFFEFFRRELEVLGALLCADRAEAALAVGALRMTVKARSPVGPPPAVFELLLALAAQEEIPIHQRHLLLFPINAFVKVHGVHVRGLFSATVRLAFAISTAQFDGGGYAGCDNARTLTSVVLALATQCDPAELLGVILAIAAEPGGPAEAFACLCALLGCVEACRIAVEARIGAVMEYAFSCSALGDATVTSAVLVLLTRLGDQLPDALAPFAPAILELAFALVDPAHSEISGLAFGAITSVLEGVPIDASTVLALISRLLALAEHPLTQADAIRAIAAAVYACREDAHAVPDALFSLAWDFARRDRIRDAETVEHALSLLGTILAFAWRKAGDAHDHALRLLLESAADEDRALRGAALRALIAIYRFHPDGGGNCAGACFLAAAAAVTAHPAADDDLPELGHTSAPEVVAMGLRLARLVMKTHPAECVKAAGGVERFGAWGAQALAKLTKSDEPEVPVAALLAAVEFRAICAEFPILELLVGIVRESTESAVVGAAVKALRKLLVRYPDEMGTQVQLLVAIAMAGVNRALPCQAGLAHSDETKFLYDVKLQPNIHALLSRICQYRAEFPIQPLLDALGTIGTLITPIELAGLFEILALFVLGGGVVPIDLILFILSKLELCDFNIPPSALFFVRVVIREHPELMAGHIPRLIPFCMEKLTAPISTSRYFWQTVVHVISLVFDIGCDLSDFIAPILARLPMQDGLREASYIYEVIFVLSSHEPELFLPHAKELFRVLIETLALPNEFFEDGGFREDGLLNMIALFRALAVGYSQKGVSQWESVAAEILGHNTIKLSRLQSRLSESQ